MIARRSILTSLTVLCALVGATTTSAPASAELTHPYIGRSFGPHGPGSGAFGSLQAVAVDQSDGDVYAYDDGYAGGSIYKFNSAGEPLPFANGTNAIEGVGTKGSDEIEMDVNDAAGPGHGDIYVANGISVSVYGADGKSLGQLDGEGTPWGEPCGVAVDTSGNVYVGLYPSTVNKYVPSGDSEHPISTSDYVSSLSGVSSVCNIAVDPAENVYVDTWSAGPVTKYPMSQFNTKEEAALGELFDNAGSTLAIDFSNYDVYIDEIGDIAQYGSAGGAPIDTFGAGVIGGSYGVAINGTNATPASGHIYVDDGEHGTVDVFGPLAEVADAKGESSLDVGRTSATLTGSVNPEGISPVTVCSFEYEYYEENGGGIRHPGDVPCSPSGPLEGSSPIGVQANLKELEPGTLYRYRLLATNSNGTNGSADQTFTTAAATPRVDVAPPSASNATRTTVLLTGTLNPRGNDAHYQFLYVDEGDYQAALAESATSPYWRGASTSALDAGSGSEEETVGPVPVSGLLPGTTYHYALSATNEEGTTVGGDHTFTTVPGTPAVVATGGASDIGPTAARLSGSVSTEGLETAYGFELGTEAGSYGAPIMFGTAGGAVTIEVSLAIAQLQPGTTYHYRLMASNVDGTSHGADATFTTPGYLETLAAPLAPPLVLTPAVEFPNTTKATIKAKGKSKPKTKSKKKAKTKKHVKAKHKSNASRRRTRVL